LNDAFRIAPDFILLRTTRRTVNDFLAQYDLAPVERLFPLDFLHSGQRVLIIGGGSVKGQKPTALTIYDAELRPRLEFEIDPQAGYAVHGVTEYPARGLHLVRGEERDVRAENIWMGPSGIGP
jgi:hypothetical protein